MTEQRVPAPSGGKTRLVIIEIVLLVAALWILIGQPLGENLSPAVAIVLALLFIGLFPAMLKGAGVAAAERDHLSRRFSAKDDNSER